MDLQLQNRRTLVTASTSGIGRAIAETLAEEGAAVILNGRNALASERVLDAMRERWPATGLVLGDVGTDSGLGFIIEKVLDLGGVDILVNNAGSYVNHDWFNSKAEDWMRLYQTNVVSCVQLAKALCPGMKARGWGRIIQISSGEGVQPFSFMPDYAATKAAMNNLTVSLSKALTRTGVTVNTVSPGIVATESLKEFYKEYAAQNGWGSDWGDIEKQIMKTVLDNNVGRLGRPGDVANLVCFIASPLADYINGANLRVDGGSTICIN